MQHRDAKYTAFADRAAALRKRLNERATAKAARRRVPHDTSALRTELQALIDDLRRPASGGRRYRTLLHDAQHMMKTLDRPTRRTRNTVAARTAAARRRAAPLVSLGPMHLPYDRIDVGGNLDDAGRARTRDRESTGTSVRTVSGGLPNQGKRT